MDFLRLEMELSGACMGIENGLTSHGWDIRIGLGQIGVGFGLIGIGLGLNDRLCAIWQWLSQHFITICNFVRRSTPKAPPSSNGSNTTTPGDEHIDTHGLS